MQQEIWKDVVGFEELFKISNFGNFYSKRTDRQLVKTVGRTGYYEVATKIGGRKGKNYCFKVHRLVAEAFLETPSEELIKAASLTKYNKVLVNHKDCNKLNNSPENLEWSTYLDNSKHAVENGLIFQKSGLDCGRYSLSQDQVEFVKNNYVPYCRDFGQRALSIKLKVSRSAIKIALNI